MQEDMREEDVTIVSEGAIEEIREEEDHDEFAAFYKDNKPPKILITTALNVLDKRTIPSKHLFAFVRDLMRMLPNCLYCKRKKFTIAEIQKFGIENDFTDIFVIGERNNSPYSMIFIHLPEGPATIFRVSGVKLTKDMKKKSDRRAKSSDYDPELIMNNFTTRLGLRVSRMFQSLIPHKPEFKGRRVITFHNQRDFIFVRHHRYEFGDIENCGVQEIGPQFTLRLEKVQLGLFDGQFGEYEWFHRTKMDTSRRRFFL